MLQREATRGRNWTKRHSWFTVEISSRIK